jgi:uncharacterized membrane protein HdeD (DUF308 family)
MNTNDITPAGFGEPRPEDYQELKKHWLLFLLLGIGVVLLGTLAIIFAFVATLATVAMFGTFLLLAGAMHLVNAMSGRNWRGFFIHLLIAVLYLVVGMLMLSHPIRAAEGLTLMLSAAFIVGGILRIVVALVERFDSWPLVLLNGFITLALGIFMWRHFPEVSFWVIGLFLGIDLVFSGWAWILLAFYAHRAGGAAPR